MLKKFLEDVNDNKEGLIIGGLVGLVAAYYALSQGFDLSAVIDSGKGLLDNIMSRSTAVEVASAKVYGVFVALGMVIGYLLDDLSGNIRPKKVARKRVVRRRTNSRKRVKR